jgi:hypothetical protein
MRLKAVLFASALALACTDTVAPVSERYQLNEIAGQALPAPYAMNPAMSQRILAADLHLNPGGRGTWTWTFELEPNGAHQTSSQGFNWTKDGNEIEITFDCGDTASCIAGPHFVGEVSTGRIVVNESSVTRTPLVFITGQD